MTFLLYVCYDAISSFKEGAVPQETFFQSVIIVPDVTSFQLLGRIMPRISNVEIDPDFDEWDFIGETRGKTFEVIIWKPNTHTTPRTVLPQECNGYEAMTAPFLAWLIENQPKGWYASQVPREMRFKHPSCSARVMPHAVPMYTCANGKTQFNLINPPYPWYPWFHFALFREMPSRQVTP